MGTIISWLTYPGVYISKMLGVSGVTATAGKQIGYSIADVVAKAAFGVLIWDIAAEKSNLEEQGECVILASRYFSPWMAISIANPNLSWGFGFLEQPGSMSPRHG